MTILYEYMDGHAPMWWTAGLFWFIAVVLIVLMVLILVRENEPLVLILILFASLFIGLGFEALSNDQRPCVKALIDNQVSWKEVNNKYKLIDQEGDIYIFEVKESVADE